MGRNLDYRGGSFLEAKDICCNDYLSVGYGFSKFLINYSHKSNSHYFSHKIPCRIRFSVKWNKLVNLMNQNAPKIIIVDENLNFV